MTDNDNLIPDRALGAPAFPTAADWDNLKETVNNNRSFRFLFIYTTGTITYNGSNSLSFTQDILIYFMSWGSDALRLNTIQQSVVSPFTTSDNQIIYVKLLDSDSNNNTLYDSAQADFDRAGDLSNDSGDVCILGYTDTTDFYRSFPLHNHADLNNKNAETDVKHLTDAQVSALHTHETTFYLYISHAAWSFRRYDSGATRNEPRQSEDSLPQSGVWYSADDAGTIVQAADLHLDISGRISVPSGKTVTITQVDGKWKNSGGGSGEIMEMLYRDWDAPTGSTTNFDGTQHAIDTTNGSTWEAFSFTGDLEITDDRTVWLAWHPATGVQQISGIKVTYTIT